MPMTHRKRVKDIEAYQWKGPGHDLKGVEMDEQFRFYVTTIHGQRAYLAEGDYVVTEPDGIHHYPCKPDIFEAGHDSLASLGVAPAS